MKTIHRLFRILNTIVLCVALLFFAGNAVAQYVEIKTNQQDETPKDSIKVIEDISKLFEQNPDTYYPQYLDTLLANKKYKNAEKLVIDRTKLNKSIEDPLLFIDLGNVYTHQGKDAKAKEQYNKAVQKINGDDMLTQRIAKHFMEIGKIDFAISTYERASTILMNPNLYSNQLATLYTKNGQLDKAIDILLGGNPGLAANVDNAKTIMLQLLGNDPTKLQQVQKIIINKINEQPNNIYLVEILTWIYTQKNDWDGALMQIEAIDERNREPGRRLLDFARNATNEKQYETADKAYNDVIAKGPDLPFYLTAKSEQLTAGLTRLRNEPQNINKAVVDSLLKRYDNFMKENVQFNPYETANAYAEVQAIYGDDVHGAIQTLQKAVYRTDIRREQVGKLKLQLGDYYLLAGKIWDASLTYSQVDKEFKQDVMGEDARFRNAKLAYYRGDFDWAQRQLLILKSATSELIANDALYLSVLITENVEDSNTYPLRRYAAADLLLTQNKDTEALTLLDSIATAFPKHPLIDDILMLHATIAEKHHEYEKAITYLEQIHTKFGTDVLGDDAVFKMADLYQNQLKDKDKAKQYYEQLIIEYPGSTFIQTARQRLLDINNPITP